MIKVEGLQKTFSGRHGTVKAVDGISFEVPEGALFTLLGPSGCGKSTTLRCVAGLEKPDEGKIEVGGHLVFSRQRGISIPPNKRDMGMVHQSYAIWPHMTVFENVAYPLRVSKKYSKKDIREKVEKSLDLVKLSGLESRPSPFLSGGQQQRLALARALVREPKVLLLDEPLSNLDAKLRGYMRLELRELQQRVRITTVYVTHDQLEALALSDIISVMQDGKIIQVGTAQELYEKPKCKFVAEFFGSTNFLEGRVKGRVGEYTKVETKQCTLLCSVPTSLIDERILVSIRPENVEVFRSPKTAENVFETTVEAAVFLGEFIDCFLDMGGNEMRVRAHPSLALKKGETVFIRLPPEYCLVVAAQ